MRQKSNLDRNRHLLVGVFCQASSEDSGNISSNYISDFSVCALLLSMVFVTPNIYCFFALTLKLQKTSLMPLILLFSLVRFLLQLTKPVTVQRTNGQHLKGLFR